MFLSSVWTKEHVQSCSQYYSSIDKEIIYCYAMFKLKILTKQRLCKMYIHFLPHLPTQKPSHHSAPHDKHIQVDIQTTRIHQNVSKHCIKGTVLVFLNRYSRSGVILIGCTVICCVFVVQRSVKRFVFWTVMGMVSSPSRSWAWPCAPWVTCPAKWSWPSSCRDWTWMVSHYIRSHTWVHACSTSLNVYFTCFRRNEHSSYSHLNNVFAKLSLNCLAGEVSKINYPGDNKERTCLLLLLKLQPSL